MRTPCHRVISRPHKRRHPRSHDAGNIERRDIDSPVASRTNVPRGRKPTPPCTSIVYHTNFPFRQVNNRFFGLTFSSCPLPDKTGFKKIQNDKFTAPYPVPAETSEPPQKTSFLPPAAGSADS